MANTKYTNQFLVDSGFNPAITPAPVSAGDNETLALSKIQSTLFSLGAGQYIGSWSAKTNTPTLSNSTVETAGNWYNVSEPGTVNFGAGDITFTTSDVVYSTGAVYAKRDGSDSSITLPDGQFLIGQANGLASPKTISNQIAIDNTGNATIVFSTRLTAGNFDGTLKGNGVQYFNTDIPVDLADMVVGTSYTLMNTNTVIKTITFTGTNVAVIGGDALTVGLVQSVNAQCSYTITRQNATTIYISN
jgi:hypothetical protein